MNLKADLSLRISLELNFEKLLYLWVGWWKIGWVLVVLFVVIVLDSLRKYFMGLGFRFTF